MIKNTQTLLIVLFLILVDTHVHGQTTEGDSLRNPISHYYLTDLELREVAQLIVKGSIDPSDNIVTLSIMDSVVHGSLESRNYFSNAFGIILIKSDGALSEVIGQYCINSIHNNPNELLSWISAGKLPSRPESIAAYITYELVMSNTPNKDKEELINKIKHDANTPYLIKYANEFITLIEDDFERQSGE